MIRAFPRHQLKLSAEVSRAVQLREVRLSRLSFHYEEPTGNCRISLATRGRLINRETQRLEFEVGFELKLLEEESEREALQLEGAFALRYSCGEIEPGDEPLAAFAEINAPYNAWPYLRELIGSLSQRAGLRPPLMLPSLHIGVKRED